MKLLKPVSCLRETGGGNVKTQTALGDALVFWSSDRGSTPLGSTTSSRDEHFMDDLHDQRSVRLNYIRAYQIVKSQGWMSVSTLAFLRSQIVYIETGYNLTFTCENHPMSDIIPIRGSPVPYTRIVLYCSIRSDILSAALTKREREGKGKQRGVYLFPIHI